MSNAHSAVWRFNPDYWPAIGLGITQTIGYGTLYYTYAILLPYMADDIGLTLSQAFGILSVALLFGGFLAPVAGRLVDRHGGRWVMTLGSLAAGLALVGMALVQNGISLFATVLLVEAAAMFVLYPIAFASIAQRRLSVSPAQSITVITLFGGVASTIFWPLNLELYEQFGWQQTWLILGIATLMVCVPIHFFALGSDSDKPSGRQSTGATDDFVPLPKSLHRRAMVWTTGSLVMASYAMGGVMIMWVVNVEDLGHTAAMAALAGAVIGPFKTIGRFLQAFITRNMHPRAVFLLSLALMVSGLLVVLTLGFSVAGIMLAAALYGMGDGINTIASGTLPLALFGRGGYGQRLGWINFGRMTVNASAPFVFALVTQLFGGLLSFSLMGVCLLLSLAAFTQIPQQPGDAHAQPDVA